MAARDERARRERIRASIKNFYQVEDASPPKAAHADPADPGTNGDGAAAAAAAGSPGQSAAPAGRGSGEMDIDSPSFNAARYTTQLLKHQSLQRLVETDNGLRRQVRSLDHELQSLVYGNYSKFLTATDTIRQVRTNVDEMDAKLAALGDNVAAMDRVSAALTADLESQRTSIEDVLAVNTVLRKVQFLVRLPDVMKRALATGRLAEATRYWVAGDAVLAKYAHIPAFQRTRDAARRGAEQVYVRLCEQVVAGLVSGRLAESNQSHKSPAVTSPTASSPATSPTTQGATKSAASTVSADPDVLATMVANLKLLAATSIDLSAVAAAGAITPKSRDGDLGHALYEHVSAKVLERFDDAIADVNAAFKEEAQRRTAELQAACNVAPSEKPKAAEKGRAGTPPPPRTAGDVAAEAIVALEKHGVKDAVNAAHTAVLHLRTSLELLVAVVGRESLSTVDVAAAAMSAAQPALESCLDTFGRVTKRHFAAALPALAGGLARAVLQQQQQQQQSSSTTTTPTDAAADQQKAAKSAGDAVRSVALAFQRAVAATCADAYSGLRAVARDSLRTAHVDNVAAFADYMAQGIASVLEELQRELAAAADPLRLADMLQVHHGDGSDAAVLPPTSATPTAGAAALFLSTAARLVSSSVLPTLEQGGALRQEAASGIRTALDDAHRRLAYAAVSSLGRFAYGAAAEPLRALMAADPKPAKPTGVGAIGNALAAAIEQVATIAQEFIVADGSAGSSSARPGGKVQHARRSSAVGSTYSRGSGDSGAHAAGAGGSSSAAGPSTRHHAGRASTAGRSTGANVQHARAAQYLRRDASAAFTSDVDRLFARPTGQSVALKPSSIDAPHVIEAAISHALSSLIDDVRAGELRGGPEGFQQLQVDAAFVIGVTAANASTWVRKVARVHALVDEWVTSAYERAVERAALPADAVTSLVAAQR